MNIFLPWHRQFYLLGCMVLALSMNPAAAADSEQALDYRIALAADGQTYQVWMKPVITPKPDLSLTGQVTIRVPADSNFSAVRVQNHVEDVEWTEAARVNAPEENPAYDYISFVFIGLKGQSNYFDWTEGEEKLAFSFRNAHGCISDVNLLENDDPFNVPRNSANTRPGNHFTNLGWGTINGNNYRRNYGEAIKCQS